MDYVDFIAKRVSQLRMEKGVSARDMSLSLRQSESYINKIENKRTLPSVTGLFYICEYFGIDPATFFDEQAQSPQSSDEISKLIKKLSPSQAEHVIQILKDIVK